MRRSRWPASRNSRHFGGAAGDATAARWISPGRPPDRTAILAPGSEGSELAPGLLPDSGIRLDPDLPLTGEVQEVGPCEAVIYKPRWGAFYDTALEAHLRSQGVSTVIFSGCNFPNCPRTSIYEASERDFRVVVASDALSGLYERGERELSAIGVALMSAREVLDSLRSQITAR